MAELAARLGAKGLVRCRLHVSIPVQGLAVMHHYESAPVCPHLWRPPSLPPWLIKWGWPQPMRKRCLLLQRHGIEGLILPAVLPIEQSGQKLLCPYVHVCDPALSDS